MKVRSFSYLVVLTGFNDPEYRLFPNMRTAEQFVEVEHGRRWDVELGDMKPDEEFDVAEVYHILKDGRCKVFSRYTTIADETGLAEGWIPLEKEL